MPSSEKPVMHWRRRLFRYSDRQTGRTKVNRALGRVAENALRFHDLLAAAKAEAQQEMRFEELNRRQKREGNRKEHNFAQAVERAQHRLPAGRAIRSRADARDRKSVV